MIFSELYSVYYNTVARIIEAAAKPEVTEKELRQLVADNAFSESTLTILPALKSEKWQLLDKDLKPVLKHKPTMPLTMLQKRWLKAIADDPRIRLFDVRLPELDGVQPLFTRDDYRIYDRYSDGDPFEDENYIRNFRFILSAIKSGRPIRIIMINKFGKEVCMRFFPKGFEYSAKDDKIRILAYGSKYSFFNLGRIRSCEYYVGTGSWRETTRDTDKKELTLTITDERNALERVMLHFAHFEKQAERLDDNRYILRLKYYESDETELVIRILSFGPYVKVTEPQCFVNLIKERLIAQKDCGL